MTTTDLRASIHETYRTKGYGPTMRELERAAASVCAALVLPKPTVSPADRREIDRLLSGIWDEMFLRFDGEIDIPGHVAGACASAAEQAIRAVLTRHFAV